MTRILIIEDNEQNLYLTRFIIDRAGLEVDEARDGRSGLKAARERTPDLVLLDIQLPEMDGFTVARALRDDSRTAHVPIVALTSYVMPEDRARVMAAGCDGMIEKPIDPESFLDEVRSYLPDETPQA